jgi:hypothetical protein
VTGLVFLAAFGLEVGESCASVRQPFPPPLLAQTVAPTAYDAPGAAGGPDLYVQKDGFRETFCADVPVDMADVMFATQRPLAAAALNENAPAGCRSGRLGRSCRRRPRCGSASRRNTRPRRAGSRHRGPERRAAGGTC